MPIFSDYNPVEGGSIAVSPGGGAAPDVAQANLQFQAAFVAVGNTLVAATTARLIDINDNVIQLTGVVRKNNGAYLTYDESHTAPESLIGTQIRTRIEHADGSTAGDYITLLASDITINEVTLFGGDLQAGLAAGSSITVTIREPIFVIEHPPTDLSTIRYASGITINSSTGTSAPILEATESTAGAMTAADKTKLNLVPNDLSMLGVTDLSTFAGQNTVEIRSTTGDDATIPRANDSHAGVMGRDDKIKLDDLGPTNIGLTNLTPISIQITSSTGNDVVLPEALPNRAGLLNAADKTKLNNIPNDLSSLAQPEKRVRYIGHYNCPNPLDTYSQLVVYGASGVPSDVARPYLFGEDLFNRGEDIPINIQSSVPANADVITGSSFVDGSTIFPVHNGAHTYFSLAGLYKVGCVMLGAGLTSTSGVTIGMYLVSVNTDDLLVFSSQGNYRSGDIPRTANRVASGHLTMLPIEFISTDIYYFLCTYSSVEDQTYSINGYIIIEEF